MKEFRKFCAIPLLLSLWTSCIAAASLRAAIDSGVPVPRRLADEKKQKLLARLNSMADSEDVKEFKAKASEIIYEAENPGQCQETNADKPMRVCIYAGSSEEDLTVEFISPAETSTLQLVKLDLDSQEIELEEYLRSFGAQFKAQAVEPADKLAVVAKTIKDFNDEVDGIEIATSGDLQKNNKAHVKVGDYQPEEGFDLQWEADKSSLTFRTNYFENELTLTMSDRTAIATEVKKVTEDVVRHLERTRRFSLEANAEDHNAEKTLTCLDLLSNQVLKPLLDKIKLAMAPANSGKEDSPSITLTFNSQNVKLSCSPVSQDGFDLLVVRVELGQNFMGIVQPFFRTSLYDLRPIAESFFEDVGTQMVQLFGAPKTQLA
jgi:hypothetical protein